MEHAIVILTLQTKAYWSEISQISTEYDYQITFSSSIID